VLSLPRAVVATRNSRKTIAPETMVLACPIIWQFGKYFKLKPFFRQWRAEKAPSSLTQGKNIIYLK
jgi:hypothetical protein